MNREHKLEMIKVVKEHVQKNPGRWRSAESVVGPCWYRMTDNEGNVRRCFIGLFITDEEVEKYDLQRDNLSVVGLLKSYDIGFAAKYAVDTTDQSEDMHFLRYLQDLHDQICTDKDVLTHLSQLENDIT